MENLFASFNPVFKEKEPTKIDSSLLEEFPIPEWEGFNYTSLESSENSTSMNSVNERLKNIIANMPYQYISENIGPDQKAEVARYFEPSSFENKKDFLQFIRPFAEEYAKTHNLDPLLTMAQMALETGYGAHIPGNNFGGIKADKNWKGKQQMLRTKEWSKEKGWHEIMAPFRVYDSKIDGLQNYFRFLTENNRYKKLQGVHGKQAVLDMAKTGYASDPEYAKNLSRVYEEVSNLV